MDPMGLSSDASPTLSTFSNIYETLYESVRLTTFSNWKSKYLTKEEASRDGRVECRTGRKTALQCVFCGNFTTLDLGNYKMKATLDKSHSPYCPIFCSHPTGNVPLSIDNVDEPEVYKFLEKYLEERKEKNHICMGYKHGYGERKQDFEEPYKRQETFKNWPLNLYPEGLIEAGFIYTGLSDFVLCHKCGGGFYNWSAEDDPMKEHETHYSACPFITLKDEGHEVSSTENYFRDLTESEKELLLKHPIGKLMTKLLRDADLKIKESLASFLSTYGVMPITFGQAFSFMHRKKDQYDKEFRHVMRYGNHINPFVCAEDVSDGFIEVSELLKSKNFEMTKINNLNRNDSNVNTSTSIINKDCIDGKNDSKIVSDRKIEIDPTENGVTSACHGSTSNLNHTSDDNETGDIDLTCYESTSNTNISAVINIVKVDVATKSQTSEIVVGSNQKTKGKTGYLVKEK